LAKKILQKEKKKKEKKEKKLKMQQNISF